MKTRKPTGLPSWPLLLLAGVEKSGKTYAAAQATASNLIGHTYWVTVGEDEPDEYGQIGDFDIVLHDGTYRGILTALREASAAPRDGEKPNLLVLDSAGRIWSLLSESAQATADERAQRKYAAGKGSKPKDEGADITMDLWNIAKQRWGHVLDVLRSHDGPVILTARLDEVTAMENGKPTKDKTWKVQAEKNLPFEVGAIVQLRAFGETYLTGVRSLRYKPKPADLTPLPPDWTIDGLWRQLGLADGPVGPRDHAGVIPQGEEAEKANQPMREVTRKALFARMNEVGIKDADDQRAFIGDTLHLGGPVESRGSLTEAQAIRVGRRAAAIKAGDPTAEWNPIFSPAPAEPEIPDPHDGKDPWVNTGDPEADQ